MLQVLLPVGAAVVGLAFGAILLFIVGANPIDAYGSLFNGAVGIG